MTDANSYTFDDTGEPTALWGTDLMKMFLANHGDDVLDELNYNLNFIYSLDDYLRDYGDRLFSDFTRPFEVVVPANTRRDFGEFFGTLSTTGGFFNKGAEGFEIPENYVPEFKATLYKPAAKSRKEEPVADVKQVYLKDTTEPEDKDTDLDAANPDAADAANAANAANAKPGVTREDRENAIENAKIRPVRSMQSDIASVFNRIHELSDEPVMTAYEYIIYMLQNIGEQVKKRIAYVTLPVVAPIVAVIELILTICSILLVTVEAVQTDRYNQNMHLNRNLIHKVTILVEKLPELKPIDELETGQNKDPASLKRRIRYLLSFASNESAVEEVEEFMGQFRITDGQAMSRSSVPDIPAMMAKYNVNYKGADPVKPGKKDHLDLIIDYLVYPIRVEELIFKNSEQPFKIKTRVTNNENKSFVYEIEHLLNETTAILTRITDEHKGVQLNPDVPTWQRDKRSFVKKAPVDDDHSSTFDKNKEYFDDMIKALSRARKSRKVFVENFTIPGDPKFQDNMWSSLIRMYEADPRENYLAWTFISMAKYILKNYLRLLNVEVTTV